ncbi:MAG: hypothetical protein MUP81_00745 [Dehalococcoidia bacterium]|nr:hypothetical protein [Dehalococcoidia bacterium]
MITEAEYAMLNKPEKKVVDWLIKHKILFNSQQPMFGGSTELGGVTVDIVLPDRNIVIRIFGGYWHSGFQAKARDLMGKENLINAGYQVVDLWEESLVDEKIEGTMKLALLGQEMLR